MVGVSIDTVPLANRGRSARRHGYHLCLRISNSVRTPYQIALFKSRTQIPDQDWLKEIQISPKKKMHASRPDRSIIHILAGQKKKRFAAFR